MTDLNFWNEAITRQARLIDSQSGVFDLASFGYVMEEHFLPTLKAVWERFEDRKPLELVAA